VNDAASATVCTGGGATSVTCEYTGSAWVPSPPLGTNALDWDDITDTMTLDAAISIAFGPGEELTFDADTFNTTDEQVLLFDIDHADDGDATDVVTAIDIDMTSESGDAGDTFGAIDITWEDGTANTIMDYGIRIENLEDTGQTMTDGILVRATTSLGILDGLDVSDAEIVYGVNIGTNPVWGSNSDSLYIGATDNTLEFRADTTSTAIIMGGDSAAPSNTIFDTKGAGTIQVGSSDVTDITLTTAGDVTVSPPSSVDYSAPNTMTADFSVHNSFTGIPNFGVTIVAALNDGTTNVAVAAPSVANCNAIVNGAEADDGGTYITGTDSYQYTWAADVATDDGIDCVIAYPAQTDPDSLGFWFRSDGQIAAGDININLDDGGVTEGTDATLSVSGPQVGVWRWIEIDITATCAAACAGIDGIEFLATAQGAGAGVLDDIVMNVDQLAMWRVEDEEAIGNVLVGGVIDFHYGLVAAGGANTPIPGVEWTSHFINYQAGADALIPITDLSNYWGKTLEALQD
jgi:hypothetical protein